MNIELSEELGIVKGLDKYSIEVFKRFLMSFNLMASENSIKDKNGFYQRVYNPAKFHFRDKSVEMKYIDLTLVCEIGDVEEISSLGASIYFEMGKIIPNKKVPKAEIMQEEIPEIKIRLKISNETTKKDVYDFLNKNFSEQVTSLSHELKHHIDKRLRKSEKISYKTFYGITSALLKTDNMLPTLSELFFFMYYTSATENLVRPSEFKTIFTSKKLTKKDFLKQYLKSNFYRIYNRIEDLNIKEFYLDIDNEVYEKLKPNYYLGVHLDYLSMIIKKIEESGLNSITKQVSGFNTEYNNDEISKIIKNANKDFIKKQFSIKKDSSGEIDPKSTFDSIIISLKKNAKNMKRKIAKVYAMIPDEY